MRIIVDMRIKEMKSWNDRIEDKIRNGVKYRIVKIDDEYFKDFLNQKIQKLRFGYYIIFLLTHIILREL